MSGIETAGLVLGAVPVLFGGLVKLRSIEKRLVRQKALESLSQALLLQHLLLSEIVKGILIICGCDVPSDLAQNPYNSLRAQRIKETVERRLDIEHLAVFSRSLDLCHKVIRQLSFNIARFVPSVKTTSEIVDILRHNTSIRDASLGCWANMRIRVSVIDIEEEIHRLEQAVVLSDRFAHRIETNSAMMVHKPNARVNGIAEAYSMVRNAAQDLHTTMSLCWSSGCRASHEAQLFLEDRIAESWRKSCANLPVNAFHVNFLDRTHSTWNEATVVVERSITSSNNSGTSPLTIDSLCAVGHVTAGQQGLQSFKAPSTGQVQLTFAVSDSVPSNQVVGSVPLRNFIHDYGALPYLTRLHMACKLSAAFLELLETGRIHGVFALDMVHFRQKVVPITPKDCQPFLTTSFSHCTAKTSSMTQLTESLSELGIALLELWHGVGLKDRYPGKLGEGTVPNAFMRKACAWEWIEQE